MDLLTTMLVRHSAYAVLFIALFVSGFGVPLPEEVVFLTAGVLLHEGLVELLPIALVCVFGVLLSDALVFHLAQRLGQEAGKRKLRQLLSLKRLVQLEEWFNRRGAWVVFGARFVTGLRTPVFSLAALHGMLFRKFILVDLMGILIGTAGGLVLGYFGWHSLSLILKDMERAEHWLLLAVAALVAGYMIFLWIRTLRERARGSPKEKTEAPH